MQSFIEFVVPLFLLYDFPTLFLFFQPTFTYQDYSIVYGTL